MNHLDSHSQHQSHSCTLCVKKLPPQGTKSAICHRHLPKNGHPTLLLPPSRGKKLISSLKARRSLGRHLVELLHFAEGEGEAQQTRDSAQTPDFGSVLSSLLLACLRTLTLGFIRGNVRLPESCDISEGGHHSPCLAAYLESIE